VEMTYGTDPDRMTGQEPLEEVAMILAAAFLRLRARHGRPAKEREFSRDNSLGCPAETRPPAVNLQRKG
jgi:hypothetical protein